MNTFRENYISLMIRTKWITLLGTSLVGLIVSYEWILIANNLTLIIVAETVIARTLTVLAVFTAAILARLWMVCKSSEKNYRASFFSWWLLAAAVAFYFAFGPLYWDIHNFLSGNPSPSFGVYDIARADFAAGAGWSFLQLSLIRGVITAGVACYVSRKQLK